MATSPRKAHDREAGEQTRERNPGERPPDWRTGVSDLSREVLENTDLDFVNELQEAPGRSRDDQADQGGEHEQDAVSPASNQLDGVGW
jgi:hypothetical protein